MIKFDLVGSVFLFNREVVGVVPPPEPGPLDNDVHYWLCQALTEEVTELAAAENPIDQVDALIDTVIFAVGGLIRMGLTERQAAECMHAVMAANFAKKAGVKASRAVGEVQDAVKPEGWVPPEDRISKILYPHKEDGL